MAVGYAGVKPLQSTHNIIPDWVIASAQLHMHSSPMQFLSCPSRLTLHSSIYSPIFCSGFRTNILAKEHALQCCKHHAGNAHSCVLLGGPKAQRTSRVAAVRRGRVSGMGRRVGGNGLRPNVEGQGMSEVGGAASWQEQLPRVAILSG